jgi:hypothetical protein
MIDRNKLQDLIPWYLNGTLTGAELQQVEDYCTNDPEGRIALEKWMQVKNFIQRRDEKLPSARIEVQLFDRIRTKSLEQIAIFHPYALGLSIVILVLLWVIIRPGVVLQWRGDVIEATTFRVYRSEVGSDKYHLLDELPVNTTQSSYTYIDLFIWPFKNYIYYVEGINQAGSMGTSQVVASHTIQALPGQISLISASFLMGYGILFVIRYRKVLLIGYIRNMTI